VKPKTFLGRAAGPVAAFLLTPDLRRGVIYRVGRPLSDKDILRVLNEDVHAMLDQHTRVGAWVARIEALPPRDPLRTARRLAPQIPVSVPPLPPRLSGVTKNNPSPHERARRSASMKATWAAKRAREASARLTSRRAHT